MATRKGRAMWTGHQIRAGIPQKRGGQMKAAQMSHEPWAGPGMVAGGKGALLGHLKPQRPRDPRNWGWEAVFQQLLTVISFGFELYQWFPNCVPENTRVPRGTQADIQISLESLFTATRMRLSS